MMNMNSYWVPSVTVQLLSPGSRVTIPGIPLVLAYVSTYGTYLDQAYCVKCHFQHAERYYVPTH